MGDDAQTAALELRELVADLKHDLAKYVAWRSANYGDDAWQGALTDEFATALQADVLRTKGDLCAWQVWDAARPGLGDPLPHPQLREVEAAVAVLRRHEKALRAGGEPLAAVRAEIRDAQQTIRSQLGSLHRTLAAG
ncbi:MAG: hypothetical protein KUG77_16400 [Nannocystaceae bacterium]|nr:hypothetical protein [Nannocystaceae bacterium]